MYSLLVLFLWAFLSGSFITLDATPYFMWVVKQQETWPLPTLVASVANVFGGITTFWIGYKGGEMAILKMPPKRREQYIRLKNYIHRYGAVCMLLSWIPFLGDVIVGLGGAMKLPFYPSVVWMTVGKTAKYIVFGLAALQVHL
jgi:membrane protein YqaA with SNARE-associated domain